MYVTNSSPVRFLLTLEEPTLMRGRRSVTESAAPHQRPLGVGSKLPLALYILTFAHSDDVIVITQVRIQRKVRQSSSVDYEHAALHPRGLLARV